VFVEYGECSRRLADCNKLLCALSESISMLFFTKLLPRRRGLFYITTLKRLVSSYLEHILRLGVRWRRHAGQPPLSTDCLWVLQQLVRKYEDSGSVVVTTVLNLLTWIENLSCVRDVEV